MATGRTFVSYSRDDSAFAVKLASDLRAGGADVWVDQLDIEAGTRWDSAVEDALRRSVRLLVLLSPKAVASQNVLDEVSFALDEGKAVLPVLVEPCAIPMRMRRLQYADFTHDYDAALVRLLGTLGVARQPPAAAAPQAPPQPPLQTPSATPPPEPHAASEPESYPPVVAADTRGFQRRLVGIAAALAAVVVLVVVWSNQRGSEAVPPAAQEVANAPVEAQPTTVAETRQDPPAKTPAAQATRPPDKASPEVTTQSRLAPAGNGSGSPFGNLTGPNGAGTLSGLPARNDGNGNAELQAFLKMTRELAGRDSLSSSELQSLVDAEFKACDGLFSSDCQATASAAVSSLFTTICSREAGAVPPASDEAATIKYEMTRLSCSQRYLSVVLNRMDNLAKDAIRHIKPG